MSVIEIRVPSIGESISEVTLSQWLKPDGAYVHMDEAICEFESDKATLEYPVEASGKLIHVAKAGDDLEIGALIARLDTTAEQPNASMSPGGKKQQSSEMPAPVDVQPEATSSNYATGHPAPAAAKLLRENAISPHEVIGSGRDGRITKGDVEKKLANSQVNERESTDSVVESSAISSGLHAPVAFSRVEHREKMSRMRRTIAKRLVSAKNNTAMLTTFNEVDMSAIYSLRTKYQEAFVKKYGIKLGFMSLFAKACAHVLLEMPEVNAFIDGDELVIHDYVDLSIAISTPSGLVVPPVHNVESLSLYEIELAIKELAEKARTGKLSLEEMSGGTFTITNGGVFGSLMSTPIINEPQSAILGMHAIKDRPVVVEGQIVIRPMMYLALSYDHRVIDGSSSVTFLVKVKELLEDPLRFVLGL